MTTSRFNQSRIFKMWKKLEYYMCPNCAKKCGGHRKWVTTETGGLQAVPTTKGRAIPDTIMANKKQCIVLRQKLQVAEDAEPLVLYDLLNVIDELKELLKIYDVEDKNLKLCEAVHCFLTLGG